MFWYGFFLGILAALAVIFGVVLVLLIWAAWTTKDCRGKSCDERYKHE